MKPEHPTSLNTTEDLSLLREALEVLIDELSTVSGRDAEHLPDLKKKKVIVASRLGDVDWAQIFGPHTLDLARLKTLIAEVEVQSRQRIDGHLTFIAGQLLALQEERQYWRECMNVSFRKFCEPSQ
jgi:hypothetical protein